MLQGESSVLRISQQLQIDGMRIQIKPISTEI